MKLLDCINALHEHAEEGCIFAQKPWTEKSAAVVVLMSDDDDGDIQAAEAKVPGFSYFLEVAIAREFLEGWEVSLTRPAKNLRRCRRLIQYAINDA